MLNVEVSSMNSYTLQPRTRADLEVAPTMIETVVHAQTEMYWLNIEDKLQYSSGTAEREMQMNLWRGDQISGYIDAIWPRTAKQKWKGKQNWGFFTETR